MSVCLCLSVSVFLTLSLSLSLSLSVSMCLSLSVSLCRCVCLSLCLCLSLSPSLSGAQVGDGVIKTEYSSIPCKSTGSLVRVTFSWVKFWRSPEHVRSFEQSQQYPPPHLLKADSVGPIIQHRFFISSGICRGIRHSLRERDHKQTKQKNTE